MKKRTLVKDEAFRTMLRGGHEPPADVGCVKAYPATVKQDEGDEGKPILHYIISTGTVDRHDDTVNPKGWRLKNYKKAPVVLWNHDHCIPAIAKSVETWVADDALHARAEFVPRDTNAFAGMIFEMARDGFLPGCSVGFAPLKYTFNTERSDWAIDYTEQELLEWSVVNVGANPEALQAAKAAGLDITPMKAVADERLASKSVSGLWLPRAFYEEAAKLAGGNAVSAQVPDAPRQESTEKSDSDFPATDAPPPEDSARANDAPRQESTDKSSDEPRPTVETDEKGAVAAGSAHPGACLLADRERTWNAQAESARGDVADLRCMAAWCDDDASDQKKAYKLLHHYAEGGHPVSWRGLKSAMSSLLGARGGAKIPEEDKQAVYDHLCGHYAQFGEEPPLLTVEEEHAPEEESGAEGGSTEPSEPTASAAPRAPEQLTVGDLLAKLADRREELRADIVRQLDGIAGAMEEYFQAGGVLDDELKAAFGPVEQAPRSRAVTPEPSAPSNEPGPAVDFLGALKAIASDAAFKKSIKEEVRRALDALSGRLPKE